MKHILRVGLLLMLCTISFTGYSQENRWRLFSEVSPVSRSSNERVLNTPTSFNLEWRNRLGIRLDKKTYAGGTLSIRNYRLIELAESQQTTPFPDLNYELNNTPLGIGVFITRFAQIKPKLYLHATAFGMIELGRGKYNFTYDTPYCRDCFNFGNGSQPSVPNTTTEINSFKERNLYTGIEVGSKFYILPKIAVYTSITLIQYEVFKTWTDNSEFQANLFSDMKRPLIQSGRNFTFLTDRPIFHFGALFHLD